MKTGGTFFLTPPKLAGVRFNWIWKEPKEVKKLLTAWLEETVELRAVEIAYPRFPVPNVVKTYLSAFAS